MFRWLPRGGQHISMPTLGNLIGKKIRIVVESFSFDNTRMTNTYILSQMGATTTTREFGLFFNHADGDVEVFYGGQQNVMLTDSRQIFFDNATGSVDDVHFDFEIDTSSGDWRLLIDGEQKSSGNVVLTGTGRIDGMRARIGARGSTDDPDDTGAAFYMTAGSFKIGDMLIYVDDVLVRHIVMPGGTNLVIPDVVAGNDASLLGSAGTPLDWNAFIGSDDISLTSSLEHSDISADSLAVENVDLSTNIDSINIAYNIVLNVDNSSLLLSAENISISAAYLLSVSDLSLSTFIDSTILVPSGSLSVSSIRASTSIEAVSIGVNYVLSLNDLNISLTADNITLNSSEILSVDSLSLFSHSESISLFQHHLLSVSGLSVSTYVDSIFLGGGVFVVDNAIGIVVKNYTYAWRVE